MGHNCEVQLFQVDALGLHIMREDVRVVAGVEQDAFAAILDKGGEPPIFLHRRGLAEGIVKDGDLGCIRLRIGWRGANSRCRIDRYCRHLKKDIPCHVIAPSNHANACHDYGRSAEGSPAESMMPAEGYVATRSRAEISDWPVSRAIQG